MPLQLRFAKVRLARTGPPVEAPTLLAWTVLLDLVVAVGLVATGVVAALSPSSLDLAPEVAWGIAGFGALLVAADVAAGRMSASGLTWRRRLGYAAMVAAVWKHGPIGGKAVAAAIVAYMGLVWIALVVGGRTLSRAIASATGEDKPE